MKKSPYWVLPIQQPPQREKDTSWNCPQVIRNSSWKWHRSLLLKTPSKELAVSSLSEFNISISHKEAKQYNSIMCLEGRNLDMFSDKYWWLPQISLQWNKSNENQDWNSDSTTVCIKMEDHLNLVRKNWKWIVDNAIAHYKVFINCLTCTL